MTLCPMFDLLLMIVITATLIWMWISFFIRIFTKEDTEEDLKED